MTRLECLLIPLKRLQPMSNSKSKPRAIPTLDLRRVTEAKEPLECRRYELQLVTPMYGGGARAGHIDIQQPIRASSIRGHLRWWWRLLNQHRFVDAKKMRERESEIWGSTECPSPVRIRVKEISGREPLKKDQRNKDGKPAPFGFERYGSEAYALFPAIEAKDPVVEHLIDAGLRFDVHVTWPTQQRLNEWRTAENQRLAKERKPKKPEHISDIGAEIEQTIAMWIQWGGVGARTRRGLGALESVGSNTLATVASLAMCQVLTSPTSRATAKDSWREVLNLYRSFRQTEFRNRGSSRPGRTHWPEPDSIRQLTNCRLKPTKHDNRDHSSPIGIQTAATFPRAVLGLPIGFKFIDEPAGQADSDRDPMKVELMPVDQRDGKTVVLDRMASPVITRPIRNGKQWHAAVLILPHDHALAVNCVLSGKMAQSTSTGPQDLNAPISNSLIRGANRGSLSPNDPMSGNNDAISAFIAFAKNKGWT